MSTKPEIVGRIGTGNSMLPGTYFISNDEKTVVRLEGLLAMSDGTVRWLKPVEEPTDADG